MRDPLGVTQSLLEPAMMPVQLGILEKRHRQRPKRAQFDSKEGTIESHLMAICA